MIIISNFDLPKFLIHLIKHSCFIIYHNKLFRFKRYLIAKFILYKNAVLILKSSSYSGLIVKTFTLYRLKILSN